MATAIPDQVMAQVVAAYNVARTDQEKGAALAQVQVKGELSEEAMRELRRMPTRKVADGIAS